MIYVVCLIGMCAVVENMTGLAHFTVMHM